MAHKNNPLRSTLSLALTAALLLSTLSLSACTDVETPSSSGSSVSGTASPDVTSDTSSDTVSTTPTVSFTFTEDLSPMPASEGLEFTLLGDGTGYFVSGLGTCTDTDLIIPATYNDLPVVSVGYTAFSDCLDITSVVIPPSVTALSASSFSCCRNLTSVTLPSTLTTIGFNAFFACDNLAEITLPASLTCIEDQLFAGCYHMKEIRYAGTSEEWFRLEKGEEWISNYADFSIVCSDTVIDAVAYDLAGVMYRIADDGTSYEVSHIGQCTRTSITIPDMIQDLPVTAVSYFAFYDCSELTSITLPDTITAIRNYAFCGCTNLTNINIPDGVTSIGGAAFSGTPYYNDQSNWENGAFYIDNCLIEVVPNATGSFQVREGTRVIAQQVLAYDPEYTLKEIKIPDSVTSISKMAFDHCDLTSITIPASVTEIRENTFYWSDRLTEVTLLGGVTEIGRSAFYACGKLTSITLPNTVTLLDSYSFAFCDALNEILYSGTTEEWQAIKKEDKWDYDTPDYTVICTDGTVAKDGTVTLN